MSRLWWEQTVAAWTLPTFAAMKANCDAQLTEDAPAAREQLWARKKRLA